MLKMLTFNLQKHKTRGNEIMKSIKWINRFLHPIACIIVFMVLLSANRVKMPGTPYELLVMELKANEGYAKWWYRDGFVNGRQAYSIGHGWNDQGGVRRKEISKYTKDGKVTYEEALEITLYELGKYGTLHKDPYKNIALKLYSYNCGPTKNPNRLGRCCGADWGCGNPNRSIRKSHSRRRKFELALWHHDIPIITRYHEENKNKIRRILSKL